MNNKPHTRFRWIGTEKEIKQKLAQGSRIAETAKGTMEYAIAGDGPPVLGIHGGVGGYDQALTLYRVFPDSGFKLICPSRPGYLRTPLSTGKTFADQADAFAALLDFLKIERVGVAGASAGGPPAYEFAMRHPDRTLALIAVDAVSCRYLMPKQAGKIAQAIFMSDSGLWFDQLLAENFPGPILQQIIKTESSLTKEEVRERVKHILADPRKLEYAIGFFRTMNPYSLRKEGVENDLAQCAKIDKLPLGKIKCPALILHGTRDADVHFADGVYAAETIPCAEHFWIDHGSHLGFLLSDQAEEAQQIAIAFFKKHLKA